MLLKCDFSFASWSAGGSPILRFLLLKLLFLKAGSYKLVGRRFAIKYRPVWYERHGIAKAGLEDYESESLLPRPALPRLTLHLPLRGLESPNDNRK